MKEARSVDRILAFFFRNEWGGKEERTSQILILYFPTKNVTVESRSVCPAVKLGIDLRDCRHSNGMSVVVCCLAGQKGTKEKRDLYSAGEEKVFYKDFYV